MKLVFGAFVWGRGGFSVRLSSRRSPPEIRATEVAPTHEGKVKCSFILRVPMGRRTWKK